MPAAVPSALPFDMPAAASATLSAGCRGCGACCAAFRVSFYWAEAEVLGLPTTLIEQIGPWYACLAGTDAPSPRCLALHGELGKRVLCSVYEQRPSPCREVQPGDGQCTKARCRHALAAIIASTGDDEFRVSGA